MTTSLARNLLQGLGLATIGLFVLAGCSNHTDRSNDTSADRSMDRSMDKSADKSADRSMDKSGGRSIDKPLDKSLDWPPERAVTTRTTAPMDREAPGKRPELSNSNSNSTSDQRMDTTRTDAANGENNGVLIKAKQVDNSGQNQVDRNSASVTPFDQGTSESDMTITQEIRKALTSDSALSTNAQNLKIITRSGAVVLRGPVANRVEADAVLEHVRTVNGITSVDNQIAVP